MKKCIVCQLDKSLEFYYKDSGKKDNYRNDCIDCHKNNKKQRVKLETITTVVKQKCFSCGNTKQADEFDKNKRTTTGLVFNCKKCRKIKSQRYYEKNCKNVKQKANDYYHKNKNTEKLRQNRRSYQKRKMKEDPLFILQRRLRNRLYYALKKKFWKKDTHFSRYIDCTLEFLKTHIESLFIDGMSWENQGKWHIDHRIPLSSAKTLEEMHKLCHYSNLQPLWAYDNLSKGAKV